MRLLPLEKLSLERFHWAKSRLVLCDFEQSHTLLFLKQPKGSVDKLSGINEGGGACGLRFRVDSIAKVIANRKTGLLWLVRKYFKL